MKYDQRGVIIPAPLQASTAALTSKRYGDKHRGPAVSDAYELSHCWIDLAEHSTHWPCPQDFPAKMISMSQSVPEGQRSDWLCRQAKLDEVDRLISYAIRSGELPIWVAPQGEPERPVAAGALATVDQRSIQGGVFCPISEEYKSEDERPWLWERPLFVKWDDWVRFVAAVQSEKSIVAKTPDKTPSAPVRAPSVKKGRPPSDEDILAKADEMKARGLDGHTIAKTMRHELGFQNVATTTVRALIKGRWPPSGRPKKAA